MTTFFRSWWFLWLDSQNFFRQIVCRKYCVGLDWAEIWVYDSPTPFMVTEIRVRCLTLFIAFILYLNWNNLATIVSKDLLDNIIEFECWMICHREIILPIVTLRVVALLPITANFWDYSAGGCLRAHAGLFHRVESRWALVRILGKAKLHFNLWSFFLCICCLLFFILDSLVSLDLNYLRVGHICSVIIHSLVEYVCSWVDCG